MSDVAVVIVAAGKSTRFTGESENHPTQLKKPFVSVRSRALWLHSVDRFLRREDVKQLILVIAQNGNLRSKTLLKHLLIFLSDDQDQLFHIFSSKKPIYTMQP